MKFATHGVLSASTGILMGDIGSLYEVASHLLDRSAFTHELASYGKPMADALVICHPELPTEANSENWQEVRDTFIAKWGEEMELDPALRGVLADDKDPIQVLREMGFNGEVIAIKT